MSTATLERPAAATATVVNMFDVNVILGLANLAKHIKTWEDFAYQFVVPSMGTFQDRASVNLLANYADKMMDDTEVTPIFTSQHIMETARYKLMHPSIDRFTGKPTYTALTVSEADSYLSAFWQLVKQSGGAIISNDEARGHLAWAERTMMNDKEDTNVLAGARALQQQLEFNSGGDTTDEASLGFHVRLVTGDGDFLKYSNVLLPHHIRAVAPSDTPK